MRPPEGRRRGVARALAGALLLAACSASPVGYAPEVGPAPPGQRPLYAFGVHPLHNPKKLFQVYGPVVDRLNERIAGARFRLEASRSYADFERKLERRELEFALPNPWQTLRSLDQGYRVIGKMGDDATFRGTLLVRRDSGITGLAQLKGRRVSAPSPTALAAAMMPFFMLQAHGVDPARDVELVFVGSQESSILSVYEGQTAASATWPVPWRGFVASHPAEAAALAVLAETDPLVNNGVVVRGDLPHDLGARVAEVLVGLSADDAGRKILEGIPLTTFELADARAYAPVARFLEDYAAKVGPPGAIPGKEAK